MEKEEPPSPQEPALEDDAGGRSLIDKVRTMFGLRGGPDTTEQLEQVQAKLGEQVKQNEDITDKLKVALASTDKAKQDYETLQAKYEQLLEKSGSIKYVESQLTNANARIAELEQQLTNQKGK